MHTADLEDLLAELRALGDDHSRVEAKRARGGTPTTIPQTLSAFSNSEGGTLLLGVDEGRDFAVTGVEDAAEIVRRLTSMMADAVDPPVRGQVDVHRLDGADVVVAVVPALARTERPCHVRREGVHRGSYVRVGDGDRRLSEYEVSLLLAGRGQPREDERPVVEATLQDLSTDLVDGFIGRLRSASRRLEQVPDEVALTMTKVLVAAPDGALVPSLAGLLCFAAYPQTFFPQLNITLAGYPNVKPGMPGPRGERFTASARFDGPVAEMVAEALVAARREMRTRSVIVGFGRRDIPEYPDLAVREALVNAVVHRDYSAGSRGSQVQLEMYPDRLVVRSPGGLFGTVEIDRLGDPGMSSARNGLLMKVLEDVFVSGEAVVENRGSGIPTMFGALRAAALPPPMFIDRISSFEVTLSNASLIDDATVAWLTARGVQGLTDSQLVALARMRNGERLKNASYRRELGVDSRQATTELKDLVDRGLIEISGTRGGATYTLSDGGGTPAVQEQLDLTASRDSTPPAEPGRTDDTVPASERVYAALVNPRSRRELEKVTGLPMRTVLRHLTRLRDEGLVEQTGAVRSPTGRWRRVERAGPASSE